MDILSRRRRETGLAQRAQDPVAELFSRFFEDWESSWQRAWNPALDVRERDDALVVTAEIPGVRSEDIDIAVEGNMLIISGQKKEQTEKEEESYYYAERRYGSFRRSIPLPATVDPDGCGRACATPRRLARRGRPSGGRSAQSRRAGTRPAARLLPGPRRRRGAGATRPGGVSSLEAGPAANSSGPRTVVRRGANTTRQHTLRRTGSTAGPVICVAGYAARHCC